MRQQIQIEQWLALPWDAVAVHFAEIALKGGNRAQFVAALRQNLRRALRGLIRRTHSYHDRLVLYPVEGKTEDVMTVAASVMGVAYVTATRRIGDNENAMLKTAMEVYRALGAGGDGKHRASFVVRAVGMSRAVGKDSPEIERNIGEQIHEQLGAPVSLENPDLAIRFRAYQNGIHLVGPRLEGPGGLPVGIAGRVLTLFSGGIDSPVAAWLVMRRGCATDFIHVHPYSDAEQVRDTKIMQLVNSVLVPQGRSGRLFLVPYDVFQAALTQARVRASLELAMFRRFLFQVADKIAQKYGHAALVTGDCLGQVASQTLESLVAADDAVTSPILRPLVAHEKRDIIDLAKRINTYDQSIQPYKDCCSLVTKRSATKPKLHAVRAGEASLEMDRIVNRALESLVVWPVGAIPVRDASPEHS